MNRFLVFPIVAITLTGCMSQQDKQSHNTALTQLQAATSDAAIKCSNKKQCDKLWSLTQVYINNKSQTKIQLANDSLIETYNPIQEGDYGLDATKTPGLGESATIQITFKCKGLDETGGLINTYAIARLQTACANMGWNLLKTYEVELKSSSKKL